MISAEAIIALAAQWRPDVLHAHSPALCGKAALIALQNGTSSDEPTRLAELLVPWLQALEDRSEGINDAISLGMRCVDDPLSGGPRRGELIVLGARPSTGKSALMINWLLSAAARGPVLACSLEDSDMMMLSRAVATCGRVNLADIRNPARAMAPMWEGVTKGLEVLKAMQIHVDDQPALTLREVRRKAQYVKSRSGDLLAVIVDYLQLMEQPGDESRAYELNRIVRGLKRMAKELGCAVILLSQLSREADKLEGPPRLDHLAESGGIEQAADIIGLLWRESRRKPTPHNKHSGQIEWAKNKNGPCDTVQLWFDGATQRWESVASEAAYAA